MNKYTVFFLSLFFLVGHMFCAVVDISNKSGQKIDYKINKAKSKGWKELQHGGKVSVELGYGKIIVEWRDKDNHYVSHQLDRPVNFTVKVGGRYEVLEEKKLDRESKTIDDNYLYWYKRLPDYLLPEKRKKFLLPLAELKEGVTKVKEAMAFYKKEIDAAKMRKKAWDKLCKGKGLLDEKGKKDCVREINNEEKRIKAYGLRQKGLEKLEKELLIREVIEEVKKRIRTKGATESYKRNILLHKKMFKEVTGHELPTEYLFPKNVSR